MGKEQEELPLTKVSDGLSRVACRCLRDETTINSFFDIDRLSNGRCWYHESHQARGHYRKIPEHRSVHARIGAKGLCSFDLTRQELRQKPGHPRGATAWVLRRASSGDHHRRCAVDLKGTAFYNFTVIMAVYRDFGPGAILIRFTGIRFP